MARPVKMDKMIKVINMITIIKGTKQTLLPLERSHLA